MLNDLEQVVAFEAVLTNDLARLAVLLFTDRQQQMLGRNKVVLHRFSLLLRDVKNLRKPRAEILLATLNTRKARDGCLNVVGHDRDIHGKLAQNRPHYSLRLLEHHGQQMLWLNLLVLISFSASLNGSLNGFLRP